eukprot:TRINITY_DN8089_c0_g1_i1.p1 TRINITY_DN8089_c0_g1~~TRINITY_DN8089_c0_g1_i1.p1  ORF type:complete len:146 (+),score=24.90 TRINITY_DN8089_c0_g1_i1:43-480(+)
MGCAASVRTTPQVQFSQVVPIDEAELDGKAQACDDGDRIRHTLRIGSTIVESEPEPANAVSFKSFYFEPSAENCTFERPLQSCAPSHRRHLRKLDLALRCMNAWPKDFKLDIKKRRTYFDWKAKFQDEIESLMQSEMAAKDRMSH